MYFDQKHFCKTNKNEEKNINFDPLMEVLNNIIEQKESVSFETFSINFPSNYDSLKFSKESEFYSRNQIRTFDLPNLLPYESDDLKTKSSILRRIVLNLYFSIKMLYLQGFMTSNTMKAEHAQFICQDYVKSKKSEKDAGILDFLSKDKLELKDEDELFFRASFEQIGCDLTVEKSTHDLINWIKLKYDIPIALRINLIKIYYSLCTSKGQNINMLLFLLTLKFLIDDENMLKEKGLVLPWEPLSDLLLDSFSFHKLYHPLPDNKSSNDLILLTKLTSFFFQKDSLPKIFEKVFGCISFKNASAVSSYMYLLPCSSFNKEQNEFDIRQYIESFFYTWLKFLREASFSENMLIFIGSISINALIHLNKKDTIDYLKFGEYGLFSKDQIKFVFEVLFMSLSIMPQCLFSIKTLDFTGFSEIIIFSINGEYSENSGLICLLVDFLNSIKFYLTPVHNDDCHLLISALISSIVEKLLERFVNEQNPKGLLYNLPSKIKLNLKVIKRIVHSILPLLKMGLKLNVNRVVTKFYTSMDILSIIDPNDVNDFFLLDIYEFTDDNLSVYKLTVGLKLFATLMRSLLSSNCHRVHVVNLLEKIINKAEPSNFSNMILILNIFSKFASCFYFQDLSDGFLNVNLTNKIIEDHLKFLKKKLLQQDDNIEFDCDLKLMQKAFLSSTSKFEKVLKTFFQKICHTLKFIPNDLENYESKIQIHTLISKSIFMIILTFSESMLLSIREYFFDFVLNNFSFKTTEIISEICGYFIALDPSYIQTIFAKLKPLIVHEIEFNDAGNSKINNEILPKDEMLSWYLSILNNCILHLTSNFSQCSKEIFDLCFFLMKRIKGSIIYESSKMIKCILTTMSIVLTSKKPKKIDDFETASHMVAYEFEKDKLNNDFFSFEWNIPQKTEIKNSIYFFFTISKEIFLNIQSLLNSYFDPKDRKTKNHFEFNDQVIQILIYAESLISGSYLLFDPFFDKIISKFIKNDSILFNDDICYEKVESDENKLKKKFLDNLNTIIELSNNVHLVFPFLNKNNQSNDSYSTSTKFFNIRDMMDNPNNKNCAYNNINEFFENDEQYLKLHLTKLLIGRCVHLLFNFFCTYFSHCTLSMIRFVNFFQVWFLNVKYVNQKANSQNKINLNYDFTKLLQSPSKYCKVFTKLSAMFRMDKYLEFRMSLNNKNKALNDIDLFLIKDICTLLFSSYSETSYLVNNIIDLIMKSFDKSYHIIIGFFFVEFENSIRNKDFRKLINGISILKSNQFKKFLENDFITLRNIIKLLYSHLEFYDYELNNAVLEVFDSFFKIKISSTNSFWCDQTVLDLIKPQYKDLDSKLDLFKLIASKNKETNQLYLKNIESDLIYYENKNLFWKFSKFNLKFLIKIHGNYEVPSSFQLFHLFFKKSCSEERLISKLGIKGIVHLINKIFFLQKISYNLENYFNKNLCPKDLDIMTTKNIKNVSFKHSWIEEMSNFSNPNYFIDQKYVSGCLFWYENMIGFTKEDFYKMNLNKNDSESLKGLTGFIKKDTMTRIFNQWISIDNSNFIIRKHNIFFISSLLMLMFNNLLENYTFNDLLSSITDLYKKDDINTHLPTIEMASGILIGSVHIKPNLFNDKIEFLTNFFSNAIDNDLSSEMINVWMDFMYWVPSKVDFRRVFKIYDTLLSSNISKTSINIKKSVTMITYLKCFILSISLKTPCYQKFQDFCFENFNQNYNIIRSEIGVLIEAVFTSFGSDFYSDYKEFVNIVNKKGFKFHNYISENIFCKSIFDLFEKCEALRVEIKNKSAEEILQSDYTNMSLILFSFLEKIITKSSNVLLESHIDKLIFPFLINFIGMKCVAKIRDIDAVFILDRLSQVSYNLDTLEKILDSAKKFTKQDLSTIQFISIAQFIQLLFQVNVLKLTTELRSMYIMFINNLLFNKIKSVSVFASKALTNLLSFLPLSEVKKIIEMYTNSYIEQLTNIFVQNLTYDKLSNDDEIIINGAVLGLGSIIDSFTNYSPPPKCVSEIFSFLIKNVCCHSGSINTIAKEIISSFKTKRQQTWELDKNILSESVLNEVECLLLEKYFV